MDELHQRAIAAVQYYRNEIEHWPSVPGWVVQSRERLDRLLTLEACDCIIDKEIMLLRRRVDQLKRHRLGVTIQ
jgi:hypothetical protein